MSQIRNTQSPSIFLGCISGTSLDGLDIAAVEFDEQDLPRLIAAETQAYTDSLKQRLRSMTGNPDCTAIDACTLDVECGHFFSNAINQFLEKQKISKQDIVAIGSHGQTLFHFPHNKFPFTLQLGDPNIISAGTGLDVVADFRRKDMALSGQGAPLVPALHEALFRSKTEGRVILNIGGISNITWLPKNSEQPVLGFDCGPGNTFLDIIMHNAFGLAFDQDGLRARQGSIHHHQVNRLLETEPYFQLPYPKSTGTEYFSPEWLEKSGLLALEPVDALATATELTARCISDSLNKLTSSATAIFVCGGGAHNGFLLQRIQENLKHCAVSTTQVLGLSPDWVEATAFAWLAKKTLNRQPGNLISVTGAKKSTILGAVYFSI